ncbi:MAG TPA: prephenate dehydratase [Thermoanaerobaculia bacterium]|nr:prephenate dehydratase [Thermoanaerobaculia bacterium]
MNAGLRVAYQGERGAFSESAARRLLGTDIAPVPCSSFESMFASVGRGDADCCVAPIENSLAGSIHRNYDLLLESSLTIAGETHLRIVHNLIAPPHVDLDAVRRVYSHPVALAQCHQFLSANPQMDATPVQDTAGSVRMVMERCNDDEAGIASAEAADIYGARILVRGVEDHAQNYTRFLLLAASDRARDIEHHEEQKRWKTSLLFRVPNQPGALFRALGAFAILEIDLTKIESRPVEGRPWEYAFYVDLAGRADDSTIARALENLGHMAEMLRILGTYPSRW